MIFSFCCLDVKKIQNKFSYCFVMFCSFDSGIFSMKFMEIWSPRIILSNQFTGQNINNIRVQYANQMFFHPNNKMLQTEVENVVVNWFDSVSFFFSPQFFFANNALYTCFIYQILICFILLIFFAGKVSKQSPCY